MNRAASVDQFIAELDHPLKADIEQLRLAILEISDSITEDIKWNAPNFRVDDIDRVTFNLRSQKKVQLILHRGAHKRSDVDSFKFTDNSGLVKWITPDRGLVELKPDDLESKQSELIDLISRWILT